MVSLGMNLILHHKQTLSLEILASGKTNIIYGNIQQCKLIPEDK